MPNLFFYNYLIKRYLDIAIDIAIHQQQVLLSMNGYVLLMHDRKKLGVLAPPPKRQKKRN